MSIKIWLLSLVSKSMVKIKFLIWVLIITFIGSPSFAQNYSVTNLVELPLPPYSVASEANGDIWVSGSRLESKYGPSSIFKYSKEFDPNCGISLATEEKLLLFTIVKEPLSRSILLEGSIGDGSWLGKIDRDCNITFQKTFSEQKGTFIGNVTTLSNGEIIWITRIKPHDKNVPKAVAFKLSSTGEQLTKKTFNHDFRSNSIIQHGSNLWLSDRNEVIKLNQDLAKLGSFKLSGEILDMASLGHEGVVIALAVRKNGEFIKRIVKVNSSGQVLTYQDTDLFSKYLPLSTFLLVGKDKSIHLIGSGESYLIGSGESNTNGSNILRYSSQLEPISRFNIKYNNLTISPADAVMEDSGDILLTGYTTSEISGEAFYAMKITPSPNNSTEPADIITTSDLFIE